MLFSEAGERILHGENLAESRANFSGVQANLGSIYIPLFAIKDYLWIVYVVKYTVSDQENGSKILFITSE
jgi:hypothetical protein